MAKTKNKRYGIHYISNGRWTTSPYGGATFTQYTIQRNPLKSKIAFLKNNVLKSRIKIVPTE